MYHNFSRLDNAGKETSISVFYRLFGKCDKNLARSPKDMAK